MNDSHIDTLDKVRKFLDGTDEIDLAINGKNNRHDFIKITLMRCKYSALSRSVKVLMLVVYIQYMILLSIQHHGQASYNCHPLLLTARKLTWVFARMFKDFDLLQVVHETIRSMLRPESLIRFLI